MENLENQPRNRCQKLDAKSWIELVDRAYKIEQTLDQGVIENTQTDAVDVNNSVLVSDTMIVPETQEPLTLLSDLSQNPKKATKNNGDDVPTVGMFSKHFYERNGNYEKLYKNDWRKIRQSWKCFC